ncbi:MULTISPECIES: type III secretion protein [unclassified Halomonas]|uniref:type III secretion protein n=1 Tax=unclassified Halomonas TaxID=2609666 RepID=UPI001CF3AA92|nr:MULTISPECIES: type III secretion protein [unclassified Halomonas]MCA8862738.1 hypothetical protein [Halomonas sp. SBBP1]UZH09754.1 type III secretion protein [Halomonas sp. BDJS001]
MTSQRQLDRLMQLRRQRTRLAEEALAAEQRHYREFEAHCQTLGQALEHHQYQVVQREQALFEQGEQRPLNAEDLAGWQQTLADDAAHQEALLEQQASSIQTLRAAERERESRATEWAHRLRAQRALEQLQTYQGQAQAIEAERLAELEMEESRIGRAGEV